ncbi:MAG: GGDEF domain-containing protein, partial [Planctomycetota bacterium]
INDNFNHHIGDQALVAFANILKEFVRSEDLVARYGGEEFILLCAHCDKESAVERAEEIRKHLANTPQPMLNGKCITASFGVAELRESESATEFFVRADNALLHAKESGRNRVIESESLNSSAPSNQETPNPSLAGIQWRTIKGSNLFCEEYITEMPISVLVEKLRGFILETHADIQHVAPEFASLTCDFEDPGNYSRKGVFMVDIEFHERELLDNEASVFGTGTRSFIRITIREGKRKWFATNCTDLAPNLAYEIRQFLMITQSNAIGVEPHATESTR